MDFLVTAFDQEGEFERRLEHRAAHLQGARGLAATGRLRSAGAILDESGRMVGSTLHMTFESRDDFEAWLREEPYVVQGVWRTVEVREMRLVEFPSVDSAST